METVGQRLWVRIILLVELHGVPSVFAPVLPVLHNHADGHLLLLEPAGGLENLVGGMETFAAVDIAQCPFGHLGTGAGQLPVAANHLVGCAYEQGVVHCFCHRGTERRRVFHFVIIYRRLVVTRQLCAQLVLSGAQTDDGGCGRRQPHVLHLYHGIPVDGEVVPTCHLLTYVEQQRIVAAFSDVERGVEDMAFAYLTLAAFRRCHVHHLLLPFALALCQPHALVRGVELRQAVVVPKNSIAFARHQHRDGDLGVHLGETPWQAAHVAVAVLKLPEAELVVVCRGVEREGGHAVLQLMPAGGEHHLPFLVLHADHLVLAVHVHLHVVFLQVVMAHV